MTQIKMLPALGGLLAVLGAAQACYYSQLGLENPSDFMSRYSCEVGCQTISATDPNFDSCCRPLASGSSLNSVCATYTSQNAGKSCAWNGVVRTTDFPSSYSYQATSSGQAAIPTSSDAECSTVWVTSTTTTPCAGASPTSVPSTTAAPAPTTSSSQAAQPTSSDCTCPDDSGDQRRKRGAQPTPCSCETAQTTTTTSSGMAAVPTTSPCTTTDSVTISEAQPTTTEAPPTTSSSSTEAAPTTTSTEETTTSAEETTTSAEETSTSSSSSVEQTTSSSEAATSTSSSETVTSQPLTTEPCTTSGLIVNSYTSCTTSGCPSIGAAATGGNIGDYRKRGDAAGSCPSIGAADPNGNTGDYGRRDVNDRDYAGVHGSGAFIKRGAVPVTVASTATTFVTGTHYSCQGTIITNTNQGSHPTTTTSSGMAEVPTSSKGVTTSSSSSSSNTQPLLATTAPVVTGAGAADPDGNTGDYRKRAGEDVTVSVTVTSTTFATSTGCPSGYGSQTATETGTVCYCKSGPTTSSGAAAVPTSHSGGLVGTSLATSGVGAARPSNVGLGDDRKRDLMERGPDAGGYNMVECPCNGPGVVTSGMAGMSTTHSVKTQTSLVVETSVCSGATCPSIGAAATGGAPGDQKRGEAPQITAPPGWDPLQRRARPPPGYTGDYKRNFSPVRGMAGDSFIKREGQQPAVTSTTWITTDDCAANTGSVASSTSSSEAAQPTSSDSGDDDCDDDETTTSAASSTSSGMAAVPTSSDQTTSSEATPLTSSGSGGSGTVPVGAANPTGNAGDYKRRGWGGPLKVGRA